MNNKDGSNLIFLIGLPRSGTTLLQVLLGQNPEIFTYSESWVLLPLVFGVKNGGMIAPSFGMNIYRTAIQDLLSQSESEEAYLVAVRSMACQLYQSCLDASGKKIFLDKTPKYYQIMTDIPKIFPKAKIIVLLRNPLAVLSSITRTWFGGKCSSILSNLVHLHSVFIGPKAVSEGIEEIKGKCYVVKYEDLVENPEKELTQLCDYIGIDYSEEMLSYTFRERDYGRLGDRKGIAQHSKPSTESTSKWVNVFQEYSNYIFAKNYLKYLGTDLFSNLGYDYKETEEKISLKWNQHSSFNKILKKTSFFLNCLKTSLKGTITSILSSGYHGWASNWEIFYPTFPPKIPDFPKQEISLNYPIISTVKPRIPITQYWEKINQID